MLLTSMHRTSIVKQFLIINEFSKRKGKKNTINIVHENTISQFKVSMLLKNSW
jgi:hypothetical protein